VHSQKPQLRNADILRLIDHRELEGRMVEAVTGDYVLIGVPGGSFRAEVRLPGRIGRGVSESKSRAICVALAELFGLKIDQPAGQSPRDNR